MPKDKSVFIACSLIESQDVKIAGQYTTQLDFTQLSEGCIGIMMVFGDKEEAEKFGKPIEAEAIYL